MSTLSFDDFSNLVDTTAPANGEQKEAASGEIGEKQPDLLLLDDPEPDDNITEQKESKSKSKKSKAKKLFKRAKSPISGAINKTTKEFKKLSNLPKHHHTSPKSPVRSPSKENLTEEYSKLEKKLAEKDSEEWRQFMQMQARVQQVVLKTQSSLHKYSSHSEDEQPREPSESYSTKWTSFEKDTGLEPEVIDTALIPEIEINVTSASDYINVDTVDLLDSKEESCLINTSFIDTVPIAPIKSTYTEKAQSYRMESPVKEQEAQETKQVNEDILGLMDSGAPPGMVTESSVSNQSSSAGLIGLDDFLSPSTSDSMATSSEGASTVLSGYTFSSVQSNVPTCTSGIDTTSKTNNDILMFEKPISEMTTSVSNVITSSSEQNVTSSQVTQHSSQGVDLFSLEEDTVDAVPAETMQEVEVKTQAAPDLVITMLQPLQPSPATPKPKDPVVPDIIDTLSSKGNSSEPVVTTSVADDFASFDPMKQGSDFMQYGNLGSSASVASPSKSPVHSFTTQGPGMTFGSVPSAGIENDIFSKIKKMSGSQPVTPVKRRVAEKPKDHFGFVKKELKADETEDDDGYKSLADIQNKKQNISIDSQNATAEKSDKDETDNVDTATVNNPFMSESFNENLSSSAGFSSANAAALFGVEPEASVQMDSGFDIFMKSDTENKDENDALSGWNELESTDTTVNKITSKDWVDTANPNIVDFGDEDMETKWDEDEISKEKKVTGNAWGAEPASVHTDDSNPFKDDFSQIDDIPVQQEQKDAVNPFLFGENDQTSAVTVTSAVNPFLDLNNESNSVQNDLLGDNIAKPVVLSDSESFFFDSVADPKESSQKESDDVFDPFKVNTISSTDTGGNAADPLDIFSSVAASGDKQLAKPSDDDDHEFTLDIKPVASDKSKLESLPIAPALAPPPKAPKSPQPPRENPFDRDSPPEENFAQFEVKDTEKPKEPVTVSKSMSEESGTVTEEEEEDLTPLEPFLEKVEKESFKLMLRYPTKKKLAGNRYWKNVCVKLEKQKEGIMVKVLNDARDPLPIQELLLQPCYSLSDLTLQQYDQYGKIHTCKLQYVFYKERVGIKTDRITPSIVKLKKRSEKPKATMILDHSPQVSELLKFGSLDKEEIMQFIQKLEDTFMNLEAHREKTLTYNKDEVTAEVRDEYYAELDKDGKVLSQKARVRVFFLAFLSGMPVVEIGLNDKRRQGKEVVGRYDIIPIKTEEWIRMQDVEFHGCVDKEDFEKTNNIKFRPLDACQFELMRYRVRLRENKELPLQLTIQQILKNRKCEIRCDLLVTGYHSYSKKHGQFPCEDIEVRFPIPEVWIYMFRYERRFGYGSVHSAARKPGKIKGN